MRSASRDERSTFSFVFVALLLVALGILYRTLGDSTALSECITVWPPFVWIVLMAPRLALLGMRRRHGEFLASLLLVAVFLLATVEWRPLLRHAKPEPTARREGVLRLVSWNVAGGLPLQDLEHLAPDLCLFQEGPLAAPSQLPSYWRSYSWQGTFDPAMLSRYPITRLATRKVGPWVEPQVVVLEPRRQRRIVVINARLMLPAPVVAAAEISRPHGLWKAHADRVAQFVELRRLLEETLRSQGTPTAIVCGDFNTPGDAASLDPLRAVLTDVWPKSGIGWGATMTAWLPVSRIDQCWLSSDLDPIEARVLRGASDHRLLMVDLALDATSAASASQ